MVCKFHSFSEWYLYVTQARRNFFFYPEHQIHQQSLLILLLHYLINLPISFTKIIVVHITIIFIWTTEIATLNSSSYISFIFPPISFCSISYWTFQMASPTMLSSCIKSVSDFQCSQNTDKLISHVLQRSSRVVSLSSII